ncbi:hypothetical protein PspCFBP13528_07660 [Pseudomonas sp. CFBP13528]|uniref:MAE_28990/MAE_18760 family HEPN-like nuclease n=1 Tax=Pseudomonas sp. CFBP13528 TaxID=2184006 RepID=UPI0010BF79AB|nr:MAE_28990/MAE_18760 family HEPN-like nuclease [Pseudomonas sp. CFBP13528]TKK33570.1 hypothetical protein PspCFBP13528_07660 [Pseudomonas sp. CFBP13528]
MRAIIADLEDREYSIRRLLDHVDEVSEVRGKIDVIVVLKSTVFISLYNNVEATVYAVIEKIHDLASSLEYDELIQPLKTKTLRYSFGKTAGAFMLDPQRVVLEEHALRSSNARFPTLSDYLRRQSLFSGNVDARKLNVIGISYGMPKLLFSKFNAEHMLWVKNKRNKIAHGEQSMSDGGQGLKTLDLRRASDSVSIILREFIAASDLYLKNRAYHKASLSHQASVRQVSSQDQLA